MYKDNITIFGEQYDLQDARLTDSDVASIGDIGNKADKVGNATAGNLAALDSTGNLTDSGAKPSDFLTQHQTIPDYTVSKLATAEQGYASSYVLQKDGVQVGATINIPKDMVVSGGEVKAVTTADQPYQGAAVGDKYIELTIANATQDKIYIPVEDLVDVYTAGSGIAISNANAVSVAVDSSNANGLYLSREGLALRVADPRGTNGAMSASDKLKLDGISAGAEVNQNAFSNVRVGDTTIAADSQTDMLVLAAGNNVTLTANATFDQVTISATVPTDTGDLTNGAGFITSSDVPSPADATPLMDGTAAVGTSTDYAREDHRHPTDTTRQAVISDLATIRSGAALGATAVQTETDPTVPSCVKGITQTDITNWNNKSDFSGSYNDLTDTPTIPTVGTLNTNNTTAQTVNPSESLGGTVNLHKVSKTGSYDDLNDKPTIPSISGLAADSAVVHKTGTETITGTKTFNAIVKLNTGIRFEPSAQDTYGLVASLGQYVGDSPVLYLESIGDGATPVLSYNVILRGLEIPQQYNDAATKEYVDDIVGDVETLLAAI